MTAIITLSTSCATLPKSMGPVALESPESVFQTIKDLSPNQGLRVNQVLKQIVIGSCMDQNYPQPVWTTLKKQEGIDLFISGGDTVYASVPKDKPISKMYVKQLQNPDLVEFRKNVPWLGTWDDHDYGVNDGGGEHPEYEEAKKSFLAFLPNSSKVISPQQKGIYHSIIVGNKPQTLQVIMLDTRSFRSPLVPHPPGDPLKRYQPTQDKNLTLLGAEQWSWLETELQKPANLRLLVSSIQIIPEEHGFEKWANFPHERERLFKLMKKYKIKNLLLVSGDRHLAEFSKIKLDKKNSLLEITASGLNKGSQLANETNKHRLGTAVLEPNYVQLDIDYLKRRVNILVKSVSGELLKNEVFLFKK